MRIKKILLFLAVVISIPTLSATEGNPFFEAGTVRRSDSPDENHAYPVIARTGAGQLFTVWTYATRKTDVSKIVGSFSKDGGRTWEGPVDLIDVEGKYDADPNVVIDGQRILVYSTTVAVPNKIDRSEVWMTYSDDEGKTWSSLVEIKMPYKYLVGKRHIGLKLRNGILAMPFSWDVWAEAGTPARAPKGRWT